MSSLQVLELYLNPNLHWGLPTSFSNLSSMGEIDISNTSLCLPNTIAMTTWYSNLSPKIPATLKKCAPIFTDGFESGDISAWSSSAGESLGGEFNAEAVCNLCVNKSAALIDQKGLKVRVQNKNVHFVQDTTPAAETRYHARFYIDINGLSMNKNNKFELFQGRMANKRVFYLVVLKQNGKYWLRGHVRKDDGIYKIKYWTVLPKTTKAVEIDYKAKAGKGFLKLYVNDVLKVKKLNVDNGTLSVKNIRLGITKKINPAYAISGAFFLDQFGSDGSITHIGK